MKTHLPTCSISALTRDLKRSNASRDGASIMSSPLTLMLLRNGMISLEMSGRNQIPFNSTHTPGLMKTLSSLTRKTWSRLSCPQPLRNLLSFQPDSK
jgi:hypothetical protein